MPMNKTQLISWLGRLNDIYSDKKEYLTELDAAIGDADHGINMNRGFGKVMEKLPTVEDKDIGTILKTVGMTLMSSVGGASGPLYGTFWMKGGMELAGKEEINSEDFMKFIEAGVGAFFCAEDLFWVTRLCMISGHRFWMKSRSAPVMAMMLPQ